VSRSSEPVSTLRIEGQPENLARIGDWVMESARACGLNQEDAFKIQLAVDEACTNVIEHAYNGQGGPIELSCQRDGAEIQVTIHDWGQPFDPTAIRPPDLAAPLKDRPIGGLGLHFMHALMDRVQFTFDKARGNILTMVKACPLPQEQDPTPPAAG